MLFRSVEDEYEIRKYIKEELASEYRISESKNGKEALEAALKDMKKSKEKPISKNDANFRRSFFFILISLLVSLSA